MFSSFLIAILIFSLVNTLHNDWIIAIDPIGGNVVGVGLIGVVSIQIFTLSLALLLIFNKTSWNIFAYSLIVLISLLRIMEGDHFLSDTIMSFIITYVIIKALYDIFKKFPDDLNLNKVKKPILK